MENKNQPLRESLGEQIAIALAEKGYSAINYANPFVCDTDAYIMGGYSFPDCPPSILEQFNKITLSFDDTYEECGQLRYYLIGVLVSALLAKHSEAAIIKELKEAIKKAPFSIRSLPRRPKLGDKDEFDEESKFIRNNFGLTQHESTAPKDWWHQKSA